MNEVDEFRPRLPHSEEWSMLISYGREYGAKEVLARFLRTLNNSKEQIDKKQDGLDYIITSESERIKTLEQLLEKGEVDQDQFEVERYIQNKYDQHSVEKGLVELYQVKAWLKKKYLDKPDAKFYNDWLDGLQKTIEPIYTPIPKTGTEVVVSIADLHVGSFIEGEELVPDYNIEEVRNRLRYIASVVNDKYSGRPVHIKFLGDFIESFSGKNHKDTWLQIEKHGMEVALTTFDIVLEFIQLLDSPASIDIVGGNHDRVTASNEEDKRGQVAYLISELLNRTLKNLDVRFHRRVLTATHDEVCYIITHGDKKITKMEPAKMVLEYGKQELFNVMLNAHGHEEKIHDTSVKYLSVQIPPVVVPNEYALDNGWTSPSGFCVFERSGRRGVDRYTYSL